MRRPRRQQLLIVNRRNPVTSSRGEQCLGERALKVATLLRARARSCIRDCALYPLIRRVKLDIILEGKDSRLEMLRK